MISHREFRLAGWSSFISVAAMIAGALFPIFSGAGLIGKLGNIFTLILALTMLPLALALYQIYRVHTPGLSTAAFLVGSAGMVSAVGLQALLIPEWVQPTGFYDWVDDISFSLIGVWFILNGYSGYLSINEERGLNSLAILVGAGLILVTIGFLISNPPPWWGFAGGVLVIVAYPVWAVKFTRKFLFVGGTP